MKERRVTVFGLARYQKIRVKKKKKEFISG